MNLRSERDADRDAVFGVHAAAFQTDAEARLVDALRASGRLEVSLVAELDGELVGHVAFSPVWLEDAGGGVGLAPIGVRPEVQGRGIGSRLVNEGLERCRRRGVRFVVLLGDPAYYGRFGFRAASEWGLRDEFGGGAAFQALELEPAAIPRGGGLVRYSEEFRAI